jgi:hypothetical protein
LTRSSCHSIPCFYAVPSSYNHGKRDSRRQRLVSAKMAKDLATELHRSRQKMDRLLTKGWIKTLQEHRKEDSRWRERLWKGFFDPRPMRLLSPKEILSRPDDPFRYMAPIHFPSFHRETGRVEWGLWCGSCREHLTVEEMTSFASGQGIDHEESLQCKKTVRRAFSEREILDHFQKCPEAKSLCNRETPSSA